MSWIKKMKEIELANSVDDLATSRSITRRIYPNFGTLEERIAIQCSNLQKKISLEEQEAQQEDRFLRGRQTAHMIHEYFRVTGTHEPILDIFDLMAVTLRCTRCLKITSWKVRTRGGYVDLRSSKRSWQCMIRTSSTQDLPHEEVLESKDTASKF